MSAANEVLLYMYLNQEKENCHVSHEYFIGSNYSQGKEKVADARRKELSKNTKSDHLTVVNAFTVGLF